MLLSNLVKISQGEGWGYNSAVKFVMHMFVMLVQGKGRQMDPWRLLGNQPDQISEPWVLMRDLVSKNKVVHS